MTPHRIGLAALAALATACSPIAVSAPTRTLPLETAETVREGHVGVRAGGGIHTDGWGGELGTGTGGVGIGVARDVELQAEGSFAWSDAVSQRGRSPFFAAGHVGVKHRVLDVLAFTGGIGFGAGPWGSFFGGDLGAILAYENPYVIPFFAARLQISTPLDASTELVTDDNGVTTMLTPHTTLWLQPSTGLRFPICWQDECGGTRVSLTLAVAWTAAIQVDAIHDGQGFGAEGGLLIEP